MLWKQVVCMQQRVGAWGVSRAIEFRRVGREAEDVAGISNWLSVDEWQSPLPRSKISRVLDSGAYINATPFAGRRVLVVGMEMQGGNRPRQ